ncbi:unannotated protein [freshwater metagenome]|uniref:Unannotated protein n=1 Tax=freshwater metagenome TaxID=449393 RepID=A0A6J6D6D6_9ZZZZ
MTASGRFRLSKAAIVAIEVKPPKATARAGMLVFDVGKGCRRVIFPQVVRSVLHGRPPQPASTA